MCSKKLTSLLFSYYRKHLYHGNKDAFSANQRFDRKKGPFGQMGFATWSLEYRRIGNEGGGWPVPGLKSERQLKL